MSVELLALVAILGAGAALTLNSWAAISANPVAALRLAADKIEQNPNRIISLLELAAVDIIKPESLESPIGFARAIVEEILSGQLEHWIASDNMQEPDDMPSDYTEEDRMVDAIKHHLWFLSVAAELKEAGGPAYVAAALRSAATRVEAAGGMMPRTASYVEGSDGFFDIVWDTAMKISPSLSSTFWTEPGSTVPIDEASNLTPAQKTRRDGVIQWNMKRWSGLKRCQLGGIYQSTTNPYQNVASAGCTYNGNPTTDLTAFLASWGGMSWENPGNGGSDTSSGNGGSGTSSGNGPSSRTVSYRTSLKRTQRAPYN
jgi:hypothetical protein